MRALGIAPEEARRQIGLFADPPPPISLLRPCTISDGITQLPEAEHQGLLQAWSDAASSGRLMKFVPASGAASRMFQALLVVREAGPELPLDALRARASEEATARDVVRLVEELPRFAFKDDLEAAMTRRGVTGAGAIGPLLSALLDADGLGFETLPKALIPFHRYEASSRTPFEEHLVEGARTVADAQRFARLHFTIAGEFRDRFAARLEDVRPALERALGVTLNVGFSEQDRATDTIAVDADNRPFRTRDGALIFRPGGHGALLSNLERLGGDVVLIKNIDNVQHESRAETTVLWKKLLAGYLVLLERRVREVEKRLGEAPDEDAVEKAIGLLSDQLADRTASRLRDLDRDDRRRAVQKRLQRPLRVCGVVRNQGEPGGGPFWVAGAVGESCQIVESSQVDQGSPGQRAIWMASTHFNPVDLVVSLRRADGTPYDLSKFVDPSTVFISKKSRDGRELKALERPGLWNGAMASWLTVFVEVPAATFSPVKTVLDLLRPEHQPIRSV